MRKTPTKMIALIAILAMMMGLLVTLPTTAGAATGMVTIDVSTLGAGNADNTANVATESQWQYMGSQRWLRLKTIGGNYTLTGTNAHLGVGIEADNINVVFENLSLSLNDWSPLHVVNDNVTITLIGNNTLTSDFDTTVMVEANPLIITGDGNLLVDNTRLKGFGFGVYTGYTVKVLGSAEVESKAFFPVWQEDSTSKLYLGDDATFILSNLDVQSQSVVFTAETPSTATWVLGAPATTSDPLTDPSITVTVPEDSSGSVSRQAISQEPSLTVKLSDATLHFLYPQIGTTRQVTVTQLLDGTIPLGDWDWEIIGNTNPAVATVVDPTSGVYDEPLTIEALAPGQTVITVKVMEFANGLTGRYGLATITVTVDGPPPTDNGGDKVPPTGDVTLVGSLVSIVMLGMAGTVCSIASSSLRKRR